MEIGRKKYQIFFFCHHLNLSHRLCVRPQQTNIIVRFSIQLQKTEKVRELNELLKIGWISDEFT